jgi:hypothetical protein
MGDAFACFSYFTAHLIQFASLRTRPAKRGNVLLTMAVWCNHMAQQQGSKGPPFWGRSPVLKDFLGGLRFRDRTDSSTELDLCPGPPAKELPRKHALCSLQWSMRPHVVFARHMYPNICCSV